jgi:hypothetical protein
VRLRDVPLSIGWGAVALFLRHIPYDSETMRAIEPGARWSRETHMLANVLDLIGDMFAKDYEHMERPGAFKAFSTAAAVEKSDHDSLMRLFGGD